MRVPTFHSIADVIKLNLSNSPGDDAVEAVELRVHMDCPGCERTVRKALSRLKGIHNVEIDREQQKVTVTGFVDKDKVLNRVRRKGKVAEFWPSEAEMLPDPDSLEPDNLLDVTGPFSVGGGVDYPYSYNRPLHYHINGGSEVPYYYYHPSHPHGPVADAFNDDNPNNCSIM
ncbi:hypothetical protein L7F22_036572 [Adiantum nelumboides]|nr:hypothetical protein [Adiantum nelumboides]